MARGQYQKGKYNFKDGRSSSFSRCAAELAQFLMCIAANDNMDIKCRKEQKALSDCNSSRSSRVAVSATESIFNNILKMDKEQKKNF